MLALAIVQWRSDEATFQASEQTWLKLLSRLRARGVERGGVDPASRIERVLQEPPPDGHQRRITFTEREADLVWSAAEEA